MQMNFLKNWNTRYKEELRYIFQGILFILTFIFTTIAGAWWSFGYDLYNTDSSYTWQMFFSGLPFSISFLSILTIHEFGHYIVARINKIRTSLPYYIPLPPFPLSLGTMGAIIRIRQRIYTNIQNFDIGIAGPLAGFVAAIAILWYGFTNLPEPEYIFKIHPEYAIHGLNYPDFVYHEDSPGKITLGDNLIFLFFKSVVADPERLPHPNEIMHYPFLFAGFLALVFTSLNLMPIGQLDGGHVLYGLVGYRYHKIIATIFYVGFLFYAGLGLITVDMPTSDLVIYAPLYVYFLYLCLQGLKQNKQTTLMYAFIMFASQFVLCYIFNGLTGYTGWLLFAFFIGRMGIAHPPAMLELPLSPWRKVIGWLALLIFIGSFTPAPL
jgi:membrane-associated protease RseP (regulator of RpoE activity)